MAGRAFNDLLLISNRYRLRQFLWQASANFSTYNETYGSLGAVIGFMVSMWISAIAILLGAELDAEMEHQTARDTTTGGERPLGARGARVADTIGERQAG